MHAQLPIATEELCFLKMYDWYFANEFGCRFCGIWTERLPINTCWATHYSYENVLTIRKLNGDEWKSEREREQKYQRKLDFNVHFNRMETACEFVWTTKEKKVKFVLFISFGIFWIHIQCSVCFSFNPFELISDSKKHFSKM